MSVMPGIQATKLESAQSVRAGDEAFAQFQHIVADLRDDIKAKQPLQRVLALQLNFIPQKKNS